MDNADLLAKDHKARAESLDPTRSFIVQAPAGSGKTELITQRFLKLLSRLNKGPEEIVAVTFTRKAAAEMRARIVAALLDAKTRQEPPEASHAKLTWQLAKEALKHCEANEWDIIAFPNRLRIVTIDALCAHLAARMPILSNFGAEPEVITDPKPLYYQAVESLMASFLDSSADEYAIKTLLKQVDNRLSLAQDLMVNMLQNRDQWLGHIFLLKSQHDVSDTLRAAFARIIEETLEHIQSTIKPEWAQVLMPLARYAANNLEESNPSHKICVLSHLESLPEPIVEDTPFWLALRELLMTKNNTVRKSMTKGLGFLAPTAAKDKEEKAWRKDHKQAMDALLKELTESTDFIEAFAALSTLPPMEITESQAEMISALTKLLPLLTAHLKLKFKDSGKVDFIEIAQSALNALGDETEPTDLALSLDYQIQHLLIDEFQDTSFQQFELFQKLVNGWQAGDGRSLFLVGDPMQSIYRFRGAEVGLFLRAQQFGLNQVNLQRLTLTQNFRSTSVVVDWVNHNFQRVFPLVDDMSLGAVSYSPALAHQKEVLATKVQFIAETNEEAQQAWQVCATILAEQKANPEDSIAVLVRARNHLFDILPLLRKLHIPYEAHDIELLGAKQSILDLLSLTQALLDLTNKVAWLAILRAPWCGLSLNDLHVLASDIEQPVLYNVLEQYETLPISDDAKSRLSRVCPILSHWLDNRRRHDLSAWVKGVWLALGAPACYQHHAILDEAKVYFELLSENSEGGDCIDFAIFEERLRLLFAEGYYEPPQGAAESAKVQLMTIHKSKGLEFDTVILPKLERTTQNNQSELLIWYERGHKEGVDLIIAPRKAQHDDVDSLYQHVSFQLKQKGELENARLLYVAATRAKKRLTLLGEVKKDEAGSHVAPRDASFLAKLWPNILTDQQDVAEIAQPDGQDTSALMATPEFKRLKSNWQLPESIAEHLELAFEPPEDQNRPEPFYNLERLIGIYVHRLLQMIGENGLSHWDKVELEHCRPSWAIGLKRLGIRDEDIDFALNQTITAISNTLQDDKARWIFNSSHQESHNEWTLSTHTPQGLKQYIIDRVFTENNTRWIVDYKTQPIKTQQDLDEAVEQYKPQLLNYVKLVKSLGSDNNVRCGLYFPLDKKWVEVQ